MFRWYQDAEVCLAYIEDVPAAADVTATFDNSTSFSRGWTLQELLAPAIVVFLNQNWEVIGHKGRGSCGRSGISMQAGVPLEGRIAKITGIPESILQDYEESNTLSIEEKLKWMENRETTREEDLSYCLLGILGASMNIRYGDGRVKMRERLLEKAYSSSRDRTLDGNNHGPQLGRKSALVSLAPGGSSLRDHARSLEMITIAPY